MKLFKIIAWGVFGAIGIAVLSFLYFDESLPEGKQGAEADALAREMMNSVNDEAWKNTPVVRWSIGSRSYVWDKVRHISFVKYGENETIIDINNRQGLVLNASENSTAEEKIEICHKAWRYWANDSFWLNPITKVFDGGTERRLVQWQGEEALLLTYTSGGNTPGDSYLWIMGEDGRPSHWKFWVSIIPVGGMTFTWEEWQTVASGAVIATQHYNLLKTISITDLEVITQEEYQGNMEVLSPFFSGMNERVKF